MPRARVIVLVSGAGTLASALVEAAGRPDASYEIVAVVADRACPGIDRAATAGLPTAIVAPGDHPDRPTWDAAVRDAIDAHEPDWIVSAGFMRVLGAATLTRFPQRILNTHPALLPSFPGARGVRDALAYGVRVTGTTVHMVDDGVDTGPILAQEAVAVSVDDTEASLHERIKIVERRLLVEIVDQIAQYGIVIDGRRAIVAVDRPATVTAHRRGA